MKMLKDCQDIYFQVLVRWLITNLIQYRVNARILQSKQKRIERMMGVDDVVDIVHLLTFSSTLQRHLSSLFWRLSCLVTYPDSAHTEHKPRVAGSTRNWSSGSVNMRSCSRRQETERASIVRCPLSSNVLVEQIRAIVWESTLLLLQDRSFELADSQGLPRIRSTLLILSEFHSVALFIFYFFLYFQIISMIFSAEKQPRIIKENVIVGDMAFKRKGYRRVAIFGSKRWDHTHPESIQADLADVCR